MYQTRCFQRPEQAIEMILEFCPISGQEVVGYINKLEKEIERMKKHINLRAVCDQCEFDSEEGCDADNEMDINWTKVIMSCKKFKREKR